MAKPCPKWKGFFGINPFTPNDVVRLLVAVQKIKEPLLLYARILPEKIPTIQIPAILRIQQIETNSTFEKDMHYFI